MISAGFKDQIILRKVENFIPYFASCGALLIFMHALSLTTHCVQMYTILRVFKNKNGSMLEKLDSLLPIGLLVMYFYLNFSYCDLAWNAPGIIVFISGAYFCLCSTKLIISNVTQQKFSTFEDMGLHAPFLFSLIMLPLHSKWS